MTALPASHPLREVLHNEVHARPYEPVTAPEEVRYFALLGEAGERAEERERLGELCARSGVAPPAEGANHFRADLGTFRLKWERHSEFSGYAFFFPALGGEPFSRDPIEALPQGWLSGLPGRLIVSMHAVVTPQAGTLGDPEAIGGLFAGNLVIGGRIAAGLADAYTDFRLHDGATSRIAVVNREMGPRQTGRMLQRLIEIEVYRIMALLAFPVAQAAGQRTRIAESELARLTREIAGSRREREPALLDELTRLAAEVESSVADTSFRFSAARAYYGLVRQRIAELREERIPGVQTITEFMDRRLSPAMNTCESVAGRQEALSRRVARASELLRTRVDIAREQQNQQLLASLDRRQRLQLRLQETVEGLSIAAVTYYLIGLIAYAAKALESSGLDVDPDLIAGMSIPVVALLVALGVRRIRRALSREAPADESRWSV
jgi:uncharacterized membrane-anchored protein